MTKATSWVERLSAGATGDAEFRQLATVLLCDILVQDDNSAELKQVDTILYRIKDTLVLYLLPSALRDAERVIAKALQPVHDGGEADVRDLIVITSITDASRLTRLRDVVFAASRGNRRLRGEKISIWGASEIEDRLFRLPALCLRYAPHLAPEAKRRLSRIADNRRRYSQEFAKLHGEIRFVGMSVYKEEATRGVEMEKIYIPLRVIPEGAAREPTGAASDPVELLAGGSRHVILGDPGSGKSTLLRFLALAGTKPELLRRYGTQADDRLPILVVLRRYAEAIKRNADLDLLGYIVKTAIDDLGIKEIDREFFSYYLYAGQGLLFFDGVDELPSANLKSTVRGRVASLLAEFPGNTTLVTSRIVGYDREVRFDDLGFSHHVIAKLRLEEIEVFVNDWYRARIPSKAERDRHAGDLVRILRDPVSRAIRELAENPLLLTIICLVHRIDAELPDERVVLYQKCTETLLNTWHTWKAQEESASRGKAERRNRSRMEAIAYWMHASQRPDRSKGGKGAVGTIERAVVAYDELCLFLAQYITEFERVEDAEALELADTFLRFIKEQAGLLIEVGSDQYSFLHLTFQEYLTATHLRKSGEAGGMEVVWGFLSSHCDDPRWHEVIRLLIGSLERLESQQFLLQRILTGSGEARAFDRAMIAGGCLIDGIDAAEDLREEILASLLQHGALTENPGHLRRVLGILQAWEERAPSNRAELRGLARRILSTLSVRGELGGALFLVALGWQDGEVDEVTHALYDESRREGKIFVHSCAPGAVSTLIGSPEEQTRIQTALIEMSLTSAGLNFASIVLAPLLQGGLQAPTFVFLLSCIPFISGPLSATIRHCLAVCESSRFQALSIDEREIRRVPAWEDALRRVLPEWSYDKVPQRVLLQALGRERLASLRDRFINYGHLPSFGTTDWWSTILSSEELYGPMLRLMCDLLRLEPRYHWEEALRIRALPRVPAKVRLADSALWLSTARAFTERRATLLDGEVAASQLLFDIGLWLNHYYDRAADSPFAQLARLTRDVTQPPLRIAHCLRSLAFGDDSRSNELYRLVKSREGDYRRLFEAACWIEQPADRKRRATGSSKG